MNPEFAQMLMSLIGSIASVDNQQRDNSNIAFLASVARGVISHSALANYEYESKNRFPNLRDLNVV